MEAPQRNDPWALQRPKRGLRPVGGGGSEHDEQRKPVNQQESPHLHSRTLEAGGRPPSNWERASSASVGRGQVSVCLLSVSGDTTAGLGESGRVRADPELGAAHV